RRILARRRAQQAADPDLRHRVLLAGRPRRAPRAPGGGAQARPPPPRPPARPLPLLGALSGLTLLAPERHGDLERAGGLAPPGKRQARLPRGQDAVALQQGALGDLRPLGEVPRRDVPPAQRGPRLRPQAHELSWALRRLCRWAVELPRS